MDWWYYIELQHALLDTLYMSFKPLLFITIVFHKWRAARQQRSSEMLVLFLPSPTSPVPPVLPSLVARTYSKMDQCCFEGDNDSDCGACRWSRRRPYRGLLHIHDCCESSTNNATEHSFVWSVGLRTSCDAIPLIAPLQICTGVRVLQLSAERMRKIGIQNRRRRRLGMAQLIHITLG